MTHRYRQFGAAVLATGCALTIAACGSSSSSKSSSGSSSSAAAGGRSAPTALKLTTTQRACLKKHGVTIRTGGARGGAGGGPGGANAKRPAGGTAPKNAKNGTFPKGKRPSFKGGRGAGAGGSSKMRTAFKDCGVTFSGPQSGGGAPGAGTGTTGG